jgi:hypothetical protein
VTGEVVLAEHDQRIDTRCAAGRNQACAQRHAGDQADDAVGPDAEREREHGQHGKAWAAGHLAEGLADVLDDSFHD